MDCRQLGQIQQSRQEGWGTSTAMAPPCMRSGRVACAQSPTPVRQPSNQGSPAMTGLQGTSQSIVRVVQRIHAWPLSCRQITLILHGLSMTACCCITG